MYTYSYAVFIGRFQPFHTGHLYNINKSLTLANNVVIVVGSSFNVPSTKNPFSFNIRKKMILHDLLYFNIPINRIIIESASDWSYNEYQWKNEIYNCINIHSGTNNSIIIIGYQKDITSYYLKKFTKWHYVSISNYKDLSATIFRHTYFMYNKAISRYIVTKNSLQGTAQHLFDFKKKKIVPCVKKEVQYNAF